MNKRELQKYIAETYKVVMLDHWAITYEFDTYRKRWVFFLCLFIGEVL